MADPYYDNVVLLLPFDQDAPGPLGTLDYSKYHSGFITVGTPVLSSAQVKYGDRSCLFTAANADRLECSNAGSLNLGDSDFTLEGWFYTNSLATTRGLFYQGQLYGGGSNKIEAQVAANGSINLRDFNTFDFQTPAGVVTTGNFQHLAFVRSGTSLYVFVNGILKATATKSAGVVTTGNLLEIGYCMERGTNQNKFFDGYIEDFRITKGIARYTADFTPPTALKADSPWSPQAFSGHNIPVSLSKPGLQWSLLPRKGVNIPVSQKNAYLGRHPYWGGPGTVSGTVKVGAVLVKRRVRLYEAKTGILILEKWANPDGTYSFPGVRRDLKYTVTATDYTNSYNDVIAANVTAV
jgi:hypothetical protein